MAMEKIQSNQLSRAFFALADPTRRAMLLRLAAGEATVSELMTPFALSQPTISKHLKVLEDAGLVAQGRDAQRRPRRLKAGALDDVGNWIGEFRRQWVGRLDRLEAHLASIKDKDT
jgi:DNA-binding transcriptional ArsR family regulator